MNSIPRRIRLDQSEPAELAIRKAVNEIEKIGADIRLTKAINLLDEARELVADFIDKTPTPVKEDKSKVEELKRRLAKEGAVKELDTRDAYAVEWTVAAMSMTNRMNYSQWDSSKGEEMQIGCAHWFNTLMAGIMHIGEYMVLHPDEKLKFQKDWGERLQNSAKDMMEWFAATKSNEAGERKFTLDDLIDAYGSGYNKAGAEWQDSEHSKPDDEPTMGQYFKEKFGIDLGERK